MTDSKKLKIELKDYLAKEIDYGVHCTLTNMFGIKPQSSPYKIQEECTTLGDVSGLITLIQDKKEGTLVISFPKETIFAILKKLYHKPFTEINQAVKMGVGEITNVIYGVMKGNLNNGGFTLKRAVPNILIGAQHSSLCYGSGPTMVIPFKTEFGEFHVQLSFDLNQAKISVA